MYYTDDMQIYKYQRKRYCFYRKVIDTGNINQAYSQVQVMFNAQLVQTLFEPIYIVSVYSALGQRVPI